MKVLVVDDDPVVTEAIQSVLRMEGYEVAVRNNGAGCIAEARAWRPDLVLLDIMMPGRMSGLDVLRVLRRDSDLPVILISARAEDSYKVLGLEYADDYLVKPFSMPEMLGRIRAVMRRAAPRAPAEPTHLTPAGDLRINTETREVTHGKRQLTLTPLEFALLRVLAARPGRVFPRDELIAQVWGADVYVDPRTLAVHIRALRRKLEDDPARPEHLLTVRGVGFRYVV